jgi:hypothetical protein
MKKSANMKPVLSVAALVLLLFTSCSLHIQKRLYRDGFYISTNQHATEAKTKQLPAETVTHRAALLSATDTAAWHERASCDSTCSCTQEEISREAISFPVEQEERFTPGEIKSQQQPASDSLKKSSRTPKTTDEEITAIRKLNRTAVAFMACSILVFPLAPITLLTAMIVSIVALNRIRRLRRTANLSAEQSAQVSTYRTNAFFAFFLSLMILLIILVLAAFLFAWFSILGPAIVIW